MGPGLGVVGPGLGLSRLVDTLVLAAGYQVVHSKAFRPTNYY